MKNRKQVCYELIFKPNLEHGNDRMCNEKVTF